MPSIRTVRIAATAAAATLLLAAVAPAADGPFKPEITLSGKVTPNKITKPNTPLTLSVSTKFKSVPAGGNFVLQSVNYQFPKGAVTNGKLFKSCSVATLKKARGVLSACPKGSQVGSGKASGTAVALNPPVSSSGKLTMFNGPGGKSLTVNIDIQHPAVINETFSAPIKKTSGKYGYKSSFKVPDTLKTIIGGDIVVTGIDFKINGTVVKNGVKRGYIEGVKCAKGGKLPFHADFDLNRRVDPNSTTFEANQTASKDAIITCRP